MLSSDNQFYLIGIQTYGFKCDYPVIHTRITSFINWIVEKIENNIKL